jgi:hypothetical protein
MKTFSVLFLLVICLMTNIFSQVLLQDNFDYNDMCLLTDHGWVAHSRAGTNPVTVVSPGLTFPGHPGSGIGYAAGIDNTGEDVHKLFTPVTSGAVYTSFMVKVSSIDTAGYFLHYSTNGHTTNYRGRVWANASVLTLAFGLSFGSGGEVFTPFDYLLDETYLLIVKYEIVVANDDSVSIYIFDASAPPPISEPGTPTLGPFSAGSSSEISPGSINLRQFLATQRIIVDGILVSTLWSDVVTDVINAEIINPVEFKLSQNYPNPFNPVTRISYSLPQPGSVTIKVYDLLGSEIIALVNEEKPIGSYEVDFNAMALPSGIYFYRLQAGSFVETKKMVLMK